MSGECAILSKKIDMIRNQKSIISEKKCDRLDFQAKENQKFEMISTVVKSSVHFSLL